MNNARVTLIQRSISVILENQAEYGSFPASPSFPHFRYCWLRDGVYTALGIQTRGYYKEVRKFYSWANRAILRLKGTLDKLRLKLADNLPLEEKDFFPARFTMEGFVEKEKTDKIPFYYEKWPEIYSLEGVSEGSKWPNFQTDCYGTWLWGLVNYAEVSGDSTIFDECRESIEIVIDYLKLTWSMPCFDPWEEYGTKRGISTLGSIAGGLIAINRILKRADIDEWIETIRTELRQSAADSGYLPKFISSEMIDGSSMWLFVPFCVFGLDEPISKATLARIEEKLRGGGVKRYENDLYFGGGEWIVLTAWLSWIRSLQGKTDEAEQLIRWMENHVETGNNFPEQVFENMNYPECLDIWRDNWWSESPAPLLWSHGMYLVACNALDNAKSQES